MKLLPDRNAGYWAKDIFVAQPGKIAPEAVQFISNVLAPIIKVLFRPELTGFEQLPSSGPFLLVGNHSAGLGIAEILCFLVLYVEKYGVDRPLAGFVLPLDFKVFPMSVIVRKLGVIPSTYEAARKTLQQGVPIMIFPGGDHETLRPIWLANRVDFGGRVGFLRIAGEAGASIVPLGISGSHYTAPVLFRSKLLATFLLVPRFLGGKRWGITGLSILGTIAIWLLPLNLVWRLLLTWLWLGSPLIFMPWIPWKIRMRIGAPIPASELFTSVAQTEDTKYLKALLKKVQSAVQAELDKARGKTT